MKIMRDPANHPVLIHCFAGIHRTGSYCAIYRMEFEHWTNARAIQEVKAFGYTNLDDEEDVLGYLERYQPTEKTDFTTKTQRTQRKENIRGAEER